MASTGSQFTQGQRADSDTRSGSGDAAMLFGVHRLFNTGHLSLGITHDLCFSVLRIDYCDARPLCSALIKLGYIYIDLGYTKAYTISIDSQKKKVSQLISYMQIDKEVTT